MSDSNPPNRPSASRDAAWVIALVLVFSALHLPGAFWGLPSGVNIAGADRVLGGEVPYRDFWTMYAPGQFYLTTGLFWLFGRELVVQGVAAVVLFGLAGGMLFRLVRRLQAPRSVAALVSAVFVSSLWSTGPQITSYAPALPLLLIAVERVVAYVKRQDRRNLIIAGALLGVAAWFKHDVAGYVVVAIMASLIMMQLMSSRRDAGPESSLTAAILYLIGPAVAVAAPVVGLVAWYGGPDAWQDLIVFPATDFRGVRAEAYAPLIPNWSVFQAWAADTRDVYKARDAVEHFGNWILCSVPQVVFVVTTGVVVGRRRLLKRETVVKVVLFLTLLVLFWSAAHVQQNTHLYSMALVSLCLGAMGWRGSGELQARRRAVRVGLVAALGVYAMGMAIPPAMRLAQVARGWSGSQALAIPGARGIRVSPEDYAVYQPIVEFIDENVTEDERIYVGLKRHDATVIGNMRFYYLSQRRNCCRYDELHPGVTDRADVQREIIDAIQEHRVNCVVLWNFGWEESVLEAIKARNAAAVEGAGSDLLDRFIHATFEPVARYGQYTLMWRKGTPRPTAES